MKTSIVASTLLSAVAVAQATTGQLGDAAVVSGLPVGVTYKATLPNKNTTTLRGTVTGTTSPDGVGVIWTVDVTGFPAAGGPFLYHIHDQPVPANGNCTATLAHLDPYIRGEVPICDPSQPQTCQVGDLSGKYGEPAGPNYQATYHDLYTSTQQGPASFFGNRSIVFHLNNKTRINCANFTLVPGNGSSSAPTGVYPPPASSSVYGTGAPPAQYTGAAAQVMVNAAALLVGLAAFAF